jgi:hypothetical protein
MGYKVVRRTCLTNRGAHGARLAEYDVKFCCSVYPIERDATGWLVGAGFGLTAAPVGRVRFDLSASASRLSGESDEVSFGSWKAPVLSSGCDSAHPFR